VKFPDIFKYLTDCCLTDFLRNFAQKMRGKNGFNEEFVVCAHGKNNKWSIFLYITLLAASVSWFCNTMF
jgi:hypothetical protein